MKKIIAILLVLSLVFAFPVLSFADGTTTTLTTTVPDAKYTMTIPTDLAVDYGKTHIDLSNLTVTATEGFNVGKNVNVTVAYTPFKAEGVSTEIPFKSVYACPKTATSESDNNIELSSGDKITFTGVGINQLAPTDSEGHTSKGTVYQYFDFSLYIDSSSWGKALGGNYTSTFTFTAEVVSAS